MKLVILSSMEKRQFGPAPMRVFIIGLIVLVLSINLYIAGSQMGWVVLLLARLGLSFIPPVLWIGAVFVVALWWAVLHRVWRQ
jgi:hypothetical protein